MLGEDLGVRVEDLRLAVRRVLVVVTVRSAGAGSGMSAGRDGPRRNGPRVTADRHEEQRDTCVFIPLLDGLALENAVVTADAAHTQHANGIRLREQGAHCIAVVKGDHPGLLKQPRKLSWAAIALDHGDRTRSRVRLSSSLTGMCPEAERAHVAAGDAGPGGVDGGAFNRHAGHPPP
ncbi:hypothetical protein GCM10010294_39010 [Streptomyces griseoloalbus]|nr:hypothetical protein GCM10010294_39010 [Streptomyces griseoloalbus]